LWWKRRGKERWMIGMFDLWKHSFSSLSGEVHILIYAIALSGSRGLPAEFDLRQKLYKLMGMGTEVPGAQAGRSIPATQAAPPAILPSVCLRGRGFRYGERAAARRMGNGIVESAYALNYGG